MMTLDQARIVLAQPPTVLANPKKTSKGPLAQAVCVCLAHLHARDHGICDAEYKHLDELAWRGLLGLASHLEKDIERGGWAFVLDGCEEPHDIAARVIDKIRKVFADGKRSVDEEASRPIGQQAKWVNTILRNECNALYAQHRRRVLDDEGMPEATLPGGEAQRFALMNKVRAKVDAYCLRHPYVFGGRMKTELFVQTKRNYGHGEHGFTNEILANWKGPYPPTREAVRQQDRTIRVRLARLLEDEYADYRALEVEFQVPIRKLGWFDTLFASEEA